MLNRLQLASKRTANSIKTQDNLHQNARYLAAKRKVFSSKTQGNLHQNAWYLAPKRKVNCNGLHKYNQQKRVMCIFITIDIDKEQRLLRYRSSLKSGYLGAKSRNFGL